MLSWKNDQVLLWLKNSHQPDDVLESFRVHNITGLTLPLLNSEELKEMGVSNLRQRLQILNDISTLLIEKNPDLGSLNLNNEHPLLSELQATVVSASLIKNISKGIVEETSFQLIDRLSGRDRDHGIGEADREDGADKDRMSNREYKMLLTKINKLREEMLPVLKQIQDKKPLPAPTGRQSPNTIHNQSVKYENTLPTSTSPSRTMFVANRRASSSDTISSISSEQVPFPLYPKSTSSSAIPQKISTQQASLPHRNSLHATQTQRHSSSPNLIPSRAFKRMSSSQADTANVSNPLPPSTSTDTLKQLRAKTEDPCYKILQAAMRSHKLDKSEWRNYVLIICYGGDKERVLRYDEKPVVVFKELSELGLSPSMMLRQVEETDDTGYVKSEDYETPGGRL